MNNSSGPPLFFDSVTLNLLYLFFVVPLNVFVYVRVCDVCVCEILNKINHLTMAALFSSNPHGSLGQPVLFSVFVNLCC